jgi:5-methylcytosine-specific restriction endonuclease McrA
VPPGRRTFCGDACVETWKLKTDPSFLRSRVWKRDKGRCTQCGLKCKDLEKGLALLRDVLGRQGRSKIYGEIRKALRIQSRHTLWDADHIRAVVDGGGECGLDNMQTLCLWCHRDKTATMRTVTVSATQKR